MNVNRNYTDSLAQTVANTCRLVVDGDSVTGYLDNRRRNTAYYEVWNKLIDYRNTSENVLQISVVNFRDGGGCYVYDTDLTENGAFLGDIRPYDEVQNAIKDELIACEKIEPLEYKRKKRLLHSAEFLIQYSGGLYYRRNFHRKCQKGAIDLFRVYYHHCYIDYGAFRSLYDLVYAAQCAGTVKCHVQGGFQLFYCHFAGW